MKRTIEGIQTEIEAIEAKRQRIRRDAAKAKRDLTLPERSLLDDMQDHILALQDEQLKLPVNAPATMQMGGSQSRSDGPFASLGEQLSSVARAGLPGGQVDQRLFAAATGANETVPSEGGFLVQQDFSAQLLGGLMETGLLYAKTNRIPISGTANGTKLPMVDESSRADGSRWGGIVSYWVAEAEEKTASKPKFRSMDLELKKCVGLCYATDEVLQDAKVLETMIRQGFSDELGFAVDLAVLRGTGVGQPLGILNSGALVTVSKEAGQSADTVMLENIVKMYSRMPARNRRNGVWLINQSIEPQLFTMSLAVGTGGSAVYLPGGAASAAPYASLLGRPVIAIEQASPLGDLGDILFCDMSQYILIEKGGVQTDMSIHVRFIFDESVFRFVLRVDGQPSWAAPLTPHDGGDPLSPFVTLEARD